MRHFYVCLLLLLVGSVALAQSLQTFKDDRAKFQIGYPSDWEQRPANFASAVFLYPGQGIVDAPAENFNVQVSRVSATMSFDMYCYMARSEVEQKYPNVKLLKSSTINIAKLKGQRFDFAGKDGGRDLQMIQILIINGEMGYQLDFLANAANYKKFSNQAEAMIRSFTVL